MSVDPASASDGGRSGPWEAVFKTALLGAFAVVVFLSGRFWSLREVREAQRAAGLAEEERLALQAELTECRNALVLERRRRESPVEEHQR
jgi:hypothetical protein